MIVTAFLVTVIAMCIIFLFDIPYLVQISSSKSPELLEKHPTKVDIC